MTSETRGATSRELRVKVSSVVPYAPIIRQTPGGLGVWKGCQFFVDDDVSDCDAWVVLEGVTEPRRANCPPENTLLITGEPPTVTGYSRRFLAQFARVISCHRDLDHPRVTNSQQALIWLYGMPIRGGRVLEGSTSYDKIDTAPWPGKTRQLSVICSAKADLEGQRQRARLVEAITTRFGSHVDVFGRGIRDFDDKREAIDPYKYHVALENTACADYWTEKLADSYLGRAYPIYWGCPNVLDYFPADALTTIDAFDPAAAVQLIERVMDEGAYERSRDSLEKARRLVLERYNVFSVAADFARSCGTARAESIEIRPAPNHGLLRRFAQQVKRRMATKSH